ncbi:MAG: WecB/TagA/CpsF family glycosyltransferase [Defluviitaleaceae bacterium]|nr:WecB/TagA/CpsF family glycosyltransferase [Defluviitaleaceae bacterium]
MIKVDVLGVKIHVISMKQALGVLNSFLKTDELKQVVTPNPEIIMKARKDKRLKAIINRADLIVPDGIGVVLANRRIKERVTGIDLITNFFRTGVPLKVYLLGAEPDVAEKAALNISKKYPNVEIIGTYHGFFSSFEIDEILQDIEQNSPDLLLVGLGSPRQEEWIFYKKPKAKIAIGCGGSIDVFAGKVKRAPAIFRKLNLEWLYRVIKEPVRLKRLLIMPLFLILTVMRKFF